MPEPQDQRGGDENQGERRQQTSPQQSEQQSRSTGIVPPEVARATNPSDQMRALAGVEQSGREPISTINLMRRTGDAVIAHMTLAYLREIGVDPNTIDQQEYRQNAHEATQGQCVYTAAMAGLFLRDTDPNRFSEMLLVQSRIADDTKEGIQESEEWNFDTWLVVREKSTGKYFTMSPALHSMPEGKELVDVYEGNSLKGIVDQIRIQREHWQWPNDREIRLASRETDNFYNHDQATGEHRFNTVATYKMGDTLLTDYQPVVLPTLEPFE